MFVPPLLQKGDQIGICAPAGKLHSDEIDTAVHTLESWGLSVVVGESVGSSHYRYAGTDELRARDLQQMLDKRDIKAILCARGGYGSIRLLERLDFRNFKKYPKWLIGFSDITNLHAYLNHSLNICSIHGAVAKTFGNKQSDDLLARFLFEGLLEYTFKNTAFIKVGSTDACIFGGNLATLHNYWLGSLARPYDHQILFVEDVDIYYYELDRMLWGFNRSGILDKLGGLVIGDFSGMKDNPDPFGKKTLSVFKEHFEKYNMPVFSNFPAGHDKKNFPLLFNYPIRFLVGSEITKLKIDVRNKL